MLSFLNNTLFKYTLVFILFISAFVKAEVSTAYHSCFKVGENVFKTELAVTPEQQKKGMMHRKSIAADEAMLFVFDTPHQASFWMRNTLITLDILFFDNKRILRQIAVNALPCKSLFCPTYTSNTSDIQYVLEIQGNQSIKRKIKIGDVLSECN